MYRGDGTFDRENQGVGEGVSRGSPVRAVKNDKK